MNNNDNNSENNAVELFHGSHIDMKSQVSAGVLNKKSVMVLFHLGFQLSQYGRKQQLSYN